MFLAATTIVLLLYFRAEAIASALNNWIVYPYPFDQTRYTSTSIRGAAFLGAFMIVVMTLFVQSILFSEGSKRVVSAPKTLVTESTTSKNLEKPSH